jgi:glucosamine kinase
MMQKFIAVDAGGTKTRCWVADEDRVLASAACATIKLMNVGEEVATARLVQLVRDTADKAHVRLSEVARTCIGLSGISSSRVRDWAETTLKSIVAGDVIVVGDEDIALEAAFQGGPGLFLIAGTGSIMTGRCADGRKFGAGGFGPVLGDEGSGGWIGWEGVRAALRARDRGEMTILLDEVMKFWKLQTMSELIAKGNDSQRASFSELAEVVARCAEQGDAVAQEVLRRAGEHLAEHVLLLVKKMRDGGCAASDTMRLRFTGSAVGKIAMVREVMTQKLHEAVSGMDVATEEVNAVEGALWIARKAADSK